MANHTSLTGDGRHVVDLLLASKQVKLAAIFTPEHGYAGTLQGDVPSGRHAGGIPIYSLHQKDGYRPTAEMLRGVDAILYDIQDVGARFYTYITTLGYVMEAAAKASIPVYVLDRPNPINGVTVEGPMLDAEYESFVGYTRLPVRHGMTVGELAQFYNGEKGIHADLHVIRMTGWERRMWYDETGLPWVNPSPAMLTLNEAILYPGTCLFDGMATSAGRGTPLPFQVMGAPWMDGRKVAEELNARKLPGVRFMARRFRPTESHFAGEECGGIEPVVVDRDAFRAVRMGLELAAVLRRMYAEKFQPREMAFARRLGSVDAVARLERGEPAGRIEESAEPEVEKFRKLRARYLLYR